MGPRSRIKLHKHLSRSRKAGLLLVCELILGAGLGLLLLGTTPERVGPFGITLFFGLLLLLFVTLGELIGISLWPSRRSPVLLWVGALTLTGYAALNTVDLGFGDIALILSFLLIFGFYWTRLYRKN